MVVSSKIYIFNVADGGHFEFLILGMFVPDSEKGTVSMLFLGVKLA
jgi:hypothetical protein